MGKHESFDPGCTRTVALVGHRSAGKTTLAEHLLCTAGALRSPGRVEQGTALLDFEADERRHHRSRRNAYAWVPWQGHRIELIDVPGMADAAGDYCAALDAVDAVVLVVDASAGLEVGAERVLALASERSLPTLVVLTKCDRVVDLGDVLHDVCGALGERAVPLHLPLRDHDGQLCGVVDVMAGVALRYADDESGAYSPEPLATDDATARVLARETLCEAVAGTDDALLEAYLEFLELSDADLRAGLAQSVRRAALTPVLLASGALGIGGSALLDAICALLPPPACAESAFAARLVSRHRDADGAPYAVFRVQDGKPPGKGQWTHSLSGQPLKARKLYQLRGPRRSICKDLGTGALVAVWAEVPGQIGDTWGDLGVDSLRRTLPPKAQITWTVDTARTDDGAHDRLIRELCLAAAEDAALVLDHTHWPPRLSGLRESHLRRVLGQVREATGLALTSALAPVRYLETPSGSAVGVEGLHLREGSMGLVEEFGACVLDLDPQPADEGNTWAEALEPAEALELPERYRPAIYEGISRGLAKGPAGYPVVGAAVRLVGGRYDMLSSTEEHFVAAGEVAVRAALQRSGTAILEPWSSVRIEIAAAKVGDVISAISACRGRIVGVEGSDSGSVLRALAPERELRSFGERLSSITRGRGRFDRSPSHYEPLPHHLVPESAEPPDGTRQGRVLNRGWR